MNTEKRRVDTEKLLWSDKKGEESARGAAIRDRGTGPPLPTVSAPGAPTIHRQHFETKDLGHYTPPYIQPPRPDVQAPPAHIVLGEGHRGRGRHLQGPTKHQCQRGPSRAVGEQ